MKSNASDKPKKKTKPSKAKQAALKAKKTYPKASTGGSKTKVGMSGKRYKF